VVATTVMTIYAYFQSDYAYRRSLQPGLEITYVPDGPIAAGTYLIVICT
jgi:hypothetical protein